jgi:hypothetical protein
MRSVDYDISVQQGSDSEDKEPASLCDQKENVTPPAKASDDASTDWCHGHDIGKTKWIIDKSSLSGNGRKATLQLFDKSQLKDAMTLAGANQPVAFEKLGERWEVAVSLSSKGGAQQVSLINGIVDITAGGDYAAYIADQVAAHLVNVVSPKIKRRRITIQPSEVKKRLCVFVNYLEGASTATSLGPTRDYHTIYAADFGSDCTLSNKFLNKVGHALAFEVFKDVRMLRAKVGIA